MRFILGFNDLTGSSSMFLELPLMQKAHLLKQPLEVSNWTNGFSQLKKNDFS
jgi:hypothetical protein